jgi:hypothetical protein
MRWEELEAAAPELASHGREVIDQFGFVFVGTLRRDGGPRVNPAEAHLVEGELCLSMLPRSLKALDLLRDPRMFLHTPVLERLLGTPGELKLRARAVEVRDAAFRSAVADTIEGRSEWRPTDDWHFFTADIESAAFLRYDQEAEVQRLLRWTPARGAERSTRTYLSPQ